MSGRPEALWPLFANLTALPGIGPKSARAFAGLGVANVRDLLFTLPQGGIDRSRRASVQQVPAGTVATVEVEVGRHLPGRGAGRPHRVEVTDARTTFMLVFFRARPDWLSRHLPTGARRVVSGKVEHFDGVPQIVHPDHIVPPDEDAAIPLFEPIYPLSGELTQRAVARAAAASVSRAPALSEWIDPSLLPREGWPGWLEAVRAAHAPAAPADLDPSAAARRRLAYDEVLSHQTALALARARRRRAAGRATVGTGVLTGRVRDALPYRPTGAQERAVAEIAADMAEPHRMMRLLQGDVGAGKTLVAFLSLLAAIEAGGQGALMAPTAILARQHRASLTPLAEVAGIRLGLLTGRDRGSERSDMRAALAAGEIDLAIGTHALFQEEVAFADLRLAVIDEQHRFGVAERMALGRKGDGVDILVMTATPIPRSLSLTQYGDMELSILSEKPPGRRPITTALISDHRHDEVVTQLRGALAAGQRAYWVCPLVSESEAIDLTAARARHASLAQAFGPDRVGLVHGQLPGPDRDREMARFAAGETRVLVATTVIEVGVDVPEATIMVIERAERFGLAQLHQLRGRVGRGTEASTCLLLYAAPLGETARRRLELMRRTEDGFEIAEVDLAMRGAGDVLGVAQSGLPRFRIADPRRDADLLAIARDDARHLLDRDPKLTGERGRAMRLLLWLHGADEALRLVGVG